MGSVLTEGLGRGFFPQKGRSLRITPFPLGYHLSLGKTGNNIPREGWKRDCKSMEYREQKVGAVNSIQEKV